jgi:hypothetical protein
LSCIGRWVAYSILRWNLSAIGYSLRKTLRDLAGAPEAALPELSAKMFLLVPPHSVNLAFAPTG